MITVLIADDHPVVRDGLRAFIELHEGVRVVGEAADGAQAVDMAASLHPDVVLMDLVMPVMDGIEATRRIAREHTSRVLVLTSFTGEDQVGDAIRAGAAGYLLKDSAQADVVRAIEAVHAGRSVLHPDAATALVAEVRRDAPRRDHLDPLTPRELEVLGRIAAGRSNKEIAADFGLSIKTVKTHVSAILMKLHLDDRTQAAVYAVREGLSES